MKKLTIKLIVVLSLSLVFTSCKENVKAEKTPAEEIAQSETEVTNKNGQTDKLKVMLHATSLPLYMNVILNNKEALHIDDEQYKKFKEISNNKSAEALKIANNIKEIEKKLYQLSLDNSKKEDLLNNLEESLKLRTSLANMKLDCRSKVLEILNEEQWTALLKMYKEKMPFNDKTDMALLIKHVNPLPNYMQLVKDIDIKLDTKQEEKLSKWSDENHPRMMELAKKVNTLEMNVYELSMNKESKENILKKVNEIADIKKEILITKTDCRDNLINTILTEDQWKKLSSK